MRHCVGNVIGRFRAYLKQRRETVADCAYKRKIGNGQKKWKGKMNTNAIKDIRGVIRIYIPTKTGTKLRSICTCKETWQKNETQKN